MLHLNTDSIINLVINVVLIITFLVKQSCTITTLKEQFVDIKEKLKENKDYADVLFKTLKHEIQEKIIEGRKTTDEHIKQLETKQDKHNTLIERMVVVEQSTKSAHNRLDALEEQSNFITKKRKSIK